MRRKRRAATRAQSQTHQQSTIGARVRIDGKPTLRFNADPGLGDVLAHPAVCHLFHA